MQKAERRRREAKNRRQKAGGEKQKDELVSRVGNYY